MSRPNKYKAQKAECAQGHKHASKKEARHCNGLHLLVRAGEIESLELHPQFYFEINGQQLIHDNGRRVGYKADFAYTDRHSARRIVDDTKGYTARDWPLRKAIFRACFPDIILREV